jgi:hypothetical protein
LVAIPSIRDNLRVRETGLVDRIAIRSWRCKKTSMVFRERNGVSFIASKPASSDELKYETTWIGLP